MTKQVKHTRRGRKAGRGKDIGIFPINSKVLYNNRLYIVKRKTFSRKSENITYELWDGIEACEVPELKIRKYKKWT